MSAAALRAASMVLLTVALACASLLHVVSPDLDPTSRRLSEYANGPYGYVMTLAFVALGAGLLALAAALHLHVDCAWRPRFAVLGLAAAGVGMLVSGIFPTDPDPAGSTRETIHSLASGSASVALIVTAASWVVLGRRRHPEVWHPSAAAGVFAAIATVLGLASPWLHRSTLTGLSQRTLWVALLGWVFLVAWTITTSTSARASVRRQRVSG